MNKGNEIVLTALKFIIIAIIIGLCVYIFVRKEDISSSRYSDENTRWLIIQPDTGEQWDITLLPHTETNQIRFPDKNGTWIYLSNYQIVKYQKDESYIDKYKKGK